MSGPLRIYRRFNMREEAEELLIELTKAGVQAEVRENSDVLDITFSGRPATEFHVLIPKDRFATAEAIAHRLAQDDIEQASKDHYLYDFTDDELGDVLRKRDAWSAFDFELAKKILLERGTILDESVISGWREDRMERLSRPDKAKWWWLAIGYASAFMGGFLAVIIGWYIMNGKKTLPDGSLVHAYGHSTNIHGQRIFWTGMVFLVLWLCVRFFFFV